MTKQKSKKITPQKAKKTTAKAKTTTAKAKTMPAKKKKATAKTKQADDIAEKVRQLTAMFETYLETFHEDADIEANLTVTERRRLHSAGVRNYGFIDKAFDIARDNPQFMPSNFDVNKLNTHLRDLEAYRQLMLVLQQWLQIATDLFMLQSNDCYMDALRIYRALQEQAKSRVSGAVPLFNALRTFFAHRRQTSEGTAPTGKELERDIKRLLHGKADGKIVIENERPKISAGKRKVVDSVRKGKSLFKETEEADMME